MDQLIFLIPIALLLGLIGLAGFLWSMKSGQFDDLEGAAWRVLDDDDEEQEHAGPAGAPARNPGTGPLPHR